MIYIVTRSDHYYPASGADDWELVTRDLDGAKQRAFDLLTLVSMGQVASENPRYQLVTLLAIDEENLHVQEIPFP